ncbi:hypothetical protein ANCCAN_10094 [Ancylostoma caninum]|uniref:Uncharacterized protein n=1 Tax=Ancylostoma caninum TaxID=29170 RepID=A0A368GHP3_ANCCA|nr:hypothetical protein ANCCAN_10094 [Ancylostoma caninum]
MKREPPPWVEPPPAGLAPTRPGTLEKIPQTMQADGPTTFSRSSQSR